MNSVEYMKQRLQDQIDWYDRRSLQNRQRYSRLRIAEIAVAATIPLFSGVAACFSSLSVAVPILVGFLGTVVTVIAGALSLGQHQERWIEYRSTCESLKKEKYTFHTRVDPYAGEDAFPLLVQRVEAILSKEGANWMQQTAKQPKAVPETKD